MDDQTKMKLILKKSAKDPVFFCEHFFKNTEMKNYKLEPHQKLFLRDRSPYKILFCSRRSGKTLSMIIDILHKAFFKRNQRIVLLSPTIDQGREFASVFSDMILRSPMLQSSFIINNKMDKQLDNGSRIAFKTAGAQSGKKEDSSVVGSGVNTLYIDECQSMSAESLSTIIPIVSGQVGQAQLILAGTPRSRSGFFYNNIQNAKTIREVYVDNGKARVCPNNGKYSLHRFQITDLDEKGNVAYSRSPYRLTIEELEVVKSTIGVEKFEREYCLNFLDTLSQPYYSELRKMAGILEEPREIRDHRIACAGIDFGKTRNNSVLTIGVQNEITNTWEIPYFVYWELGTSYKTITHYINNILPVLFPNLQAVAIDKTGVGNGLSDFIDYNSTYMVYDIIFSQPMKVDLVETTINNLENRYVIYYPHEILEREMGEYSREATENNRTKYIKGESDDFIDSFNLCNMAITKYIQDGPKRERPFFVGSMNETLLNNKSYRQAVRNNWSNNYGELKDKKI